MEGGYGEETVHQKRMVRGQVRDVDAPELLNVGMVADCVGRGYGPVVHQTQIDQIQL